MKKKNNFTVMNVNSCLNINDPPLIDVHYPCDYCGGYTKRVKSYTKESIGLMFDIEDEGVHMKCCMRCWKKVFDVVLGGSTGKVVKPKCGQMMHDLSG